MRSTEVRRWLGRALLLGLPVVFLACAAGTPPPGPVDIVREIVDPSYDYRDNPDTWGGKDPRQARHRDDDGWSATCRAGELTCSQQGATVCCSPRDRCCAGRTGPFCCGDDRYDDDR